MKRPLIALLTLSLVLSLFLTTPALCEEAPTWQDEFNAMWSSIMTIAFEFDDPPQEGTLVSGHMGEHLLLTVKAAEEEGKVEVMVEITPIDEAAEDAEEEEAPVDAPPLFDEEKTGVLIALNAAIKAQRPELAEDSDVINALSVAISTEIFQTEGYNSSHDGLEKTLQMENGVVYVELIDSEQQIIWYKLIL